LEELLYTDLPADMDHPNSQGYTARQIVLEALEAEQLRRDHAETLRAAARRRREEAEWRSRLCDELHEDGNVAGSWWGDDWAASGSNLERGGSRAWEEEEEEYRARIVREINERRARVPASASGTADPGGQAKGPHAGPSAREEKERHWRQVLEEEVEKDRQWRQRVAQGKSTAEMRADYEQRWQTFLLQDKEPGSVAYNDIPWIAPPSKGGNVIGEVALAGVGPTDQAARKKRLRMELMRWHPDKFMARFSSCIRPGEADRVLGGVTETSAALTQLGT